MSSADGSGIKRQASEITTDLTSHPAQGVTTPQDGVQQPAKRRRFGPVSGGDESFTSVSVPAPPPASSTPASVSALVQQARERAQALLSMRQAAASGTAVTPASSTPVVTTTSTVPTTPPPQSASTLPVVSGARDALARITELQGKMALQKAAAAAASSTTPTPAVTVTPAVPATAGTQSRFSSLVPPASAALPATAGIVYVSSADEIQPVRFDAQGRPLDAYGNIIELLPRRRAVGGDKKKAVAPKDAAVDAAEQKKRKEKEREKEREKAQKKEKEAEEAAAASRFVDPSLADVSRSRRKAMFQLVAPGEYSRRAAAMRMERATVLLESATAEAKARAEARDEAFVDWECVVLSGSTGLERAGAASVFVLSGGSEWWDHTLLKSGAPYAAQQPPPTVVPYPAVSAEGFETEQGPISASSEQFRTYIEQSYPKPVPGATQWPIPTVTGANTISHHVHFPRRLAPVIPPPIAKPVAVMLTKEERKKARRQRRMAAERDKQDLIRAGVLPAPEPRIKLSNLARVLGSAMVSDPTALEAKAKAQMAARVQKHIEHNLATMLTAEQRREKLVKKYSEATEHEVHVAVFRCGSLLSGKAKFKVRTGAQELYLTGIAMMNNKGNVVVVEGGLKGIKRFTALMMRRLKWDELHDMGGKQEEGGDAAAAADEGSERVYDGYSPHKDCQLVWTGTLTKRLFKNFHFENSLSKVEAREKMVSQGAAQYWDLAQSFF